MTSLIQHTQALLKARERERRKRLEEMPLPAAPSDTDTALRWRRGDLRHLLRPNQVALYQHIKQTLWPNGYGKPGGERRHVEECHRRYGKSSVWGIIALELCLTLPDALVYWAASTGKQVSKILSTVLRPFLKECPEDIRPQWKKSDGVYVFPTTGALLYIGGCEDEAKADALRGDGADLFLIDEAGSIDILLYVYRSIALWMTADRHGKIGMPSTPARTPGHPFTMYCELAEAGQGGFWKQTVVDSGWSEALIDELADECGGKGTVDFLREAMCERIVDAARAILAEATEADKDERNPLVCEVERPRYFDIYTVQDLGYSPDLTFVIFGYFDFENRWYVVLDELVLERMVTPDLADGVKAKEAALWARHYADWSDAYRPQYGDTPPKAEPYLRISDIEPQVMADLYRLHGLSFTPVEKRSDGRLSAKLSMINRTKIALRERRVKIHPRCKNLRAHLRAGIWNKRRTDYERVEGFGHFDGCDALIYFVCSVVESHNPFPSVPDDVSHDTHFVYPREKKGERKIAEMFRPRVKR